MAKKNVLEFEMRDGQGFIRPTDPGIYCVSPFDNSNQQNKVTGEKEKDVGIYKVGVASKSIHSRMQQYHTYFPAGVYFIALLTVKPKAVIPKSVEPLKVFMGSFLQFLNIVEKWIIHRLQQSQAVVLKNNMRIKWEGDTEWVYCSITLIQKVYEEARQYFSGHQTYKTQYTFTLTEHDRAPDHEAHLEKLKNSHVHIAKLYFDLTNGLYKKK